MNYREEILALMDKQDIKGLGKYHVPLEQSDADIDERLNHLAEELMDGLRYVFWLKSWGEQNKCPKIKW